MSGRTGEPAVNAAGGHHAAVRARLLRSECPRAGPDSITRKVNREMIVVAGWGRAILLQLAHPAVAAGVHHHSGFRGSLLNSVGRLRSTVGAMLSLTFGDREQMIAAAAGINAIHDRVRGRVPERTNEELCRLKTPYPLRRLRLRAFFDSPAAVSSLLLSLLHSLQFMVRSRASLHLEIIALRHQLAVVHRSRRPRLRLTSADRALWAWLSQAWDGWRSAVINVKPETVITWHRCGVRLGFTGSFRSWASR